LTKAPAVEFTGVKRLHLQYIKSVASYCTPHSESYLIFGTQAHWDEATLNSDNQSASHCKGLPILLYAYLTSRILKSEYPKQKQKY
jgi:hypothetical protein